MWWNRANRNAELWPVMLIRSTCDESLVMFRTAGRAELRFIYSEMLHLKLTLCLVKTTTTAGVACTNTSECSPAAPRQNFDICSRALSSCCSPRRRRERGCWLCSWNIWSFHDPVWVPHSFFFPPSVCKSRKSQFGFKTGASADFSPSLWQAVTLC